MPLSFVRAAALQAAPVSVPPPAPVCIRAGDLPPAFAGWNAPPENARGLVIGRPFIARGMAADTIAWPAAAVAAGRPGKGSVMRFKVAAPGIYRVALSEAAWIDVVRGGIALASVAHGHGPACTGLRKIVDFRLTPGVYALQLAGMPGDSVKVMIVPS